MRRIFFTGLACFLISAPIFAHATVRITEIMYDLPGTDTGREWVEVWNDGTETVQLSAWKLFEESVNHKLTFTQGSESLDAGAYAIIADNTASFLNDWPQFLGALFDSSFSLKNTGETIVLRDGELKDVDTILYDTSLGAGGNGDSIQLINGVWRAASSTPGIAFLQSGGESHAVTSSETSSNVATGDQVWIIDTDTISVFAGKDKEVIVGADTMFEGKAIGTAGKPLENARFVWSFGDGGRVEGTPVLHSFVYPGTYRVALDVSSGKYAASDFLTVKALPAEIIISRVASGADSFIELYNKTSRELDLSWWRLKSGSAYFTFPKNTFLLPDTKIIFPFQITKLPILNARDVALLYPNGAVAVVYTEDEKTVSVSRGAISETLSQTVSSPLLKTKNTLSNNAFLPERQKIKEERTEIPFAVAATLPAAQELPKASAYPSLLWLFGAAALSFLAVASTLAGRKKEDVELTADDIEIVE